MKNENYILTNIIAGIILAVLAAFIYSAATDPGTGIKLTDPTVMENRVGYEFLHKNVKDPDSTYGWGGTAEDTSANIVTSVVVDYRLFDTTLEVVVLFITVLGLGAIIPKDKRRIRRPTTILRTWAPMLGLFMLLAGGYMFMNGHLSPGGGFPAGAIISTGVLAGLLAGGRTVKQKTLKIAETAAGVTIFGLGILGYVITGSFFENFLPGGQIGELFSAGLIPVFYGLIAVKVGAELSNIYFEFYEEG